MNILYANWKCFGATDIIEAFRQLGENVYEVEITDASHDRIDWEFVDKLKTNMEKYKIDIVFSFNFFPTLSEACYKYGRKYLSWVYDSPSLKLYLPSIVNECNYVFTFDRATEQEFIQKDVTTVYYSPLAVNVKRLNRLSRKKTDVSRYLCDISFVGSLYNEIGLYERLVEKSDNPYLIGYLEGLMEAQLKVFGFNFLKDSLRPEIVKQIYEIMPFDVQAGTLTDRETVYADYFLYKRMTSLERTRILMRLAERYQVYHYTSDSTIHIGKVNNRGKVDYYDEMPLAFFNTKINLNMTLRSIKTGIPLRAMDILGAGGFLLTNYQADFLLHFEPDKDFVYYGSMEELEDKVAWYLNHDSNRIEIALNGRKKIEMNHTYETTLKKMLKVVK